MAAPCRDDAGYALSDRIVLKDGTIEISDRVWESEKYIHFILKGTKTVEVRYAKEIVDRIEPNTFSEAGGGKPPGKPASVEQRSEWVSIATPGKVPPSGIPQDLQKQTPASPTGKDLSAKIDSSMVAGLRNISFYDPHRPKRYWSSQNSRHTNLKDAVDALAALYGRSSEWVEANMGDENDLGSIHLRLLAHKLRERRRRIGRQTSNPNCPSLFFMMTAGFTTTGIAGKCARMEVAGYARRSSIL